jgi:hypothetical protein
MTSEAMPALLKRTSPTFAKKLISTIHHSFIQFAVLVIAFEFLPENNE